MYSSPVIVAPAAAVGTGSCQTRVRLRVVSGLEAANPSATSRALPRAPGSSTPAAAAGPPSLDGAGRRRAG